MFLITSPKNECTLAGQLMEGVGTQVEERVCPAMADSLFPGGTFCFNSSNQFSTILFCVGAACACSLDLIIRKRWPSDETSIGSGGGSYRPSKSIQGVLAAKLGCVAISTAVPRQNLIRDKMAQFSISRPWDEMLAGSLESQNPPAPRESCRRRNLCLANCYTRGDSTVNRAADVSCVSLR
jgi:hypothetical protein